MSAYSIKVSYKENDEIELVCSGNLIINNIEKIYEELREQLTCQQPTSIIIDNPENLDTTFVQLCFAVRKSVLENGKEFKIKTTIKDDLKTLVLKAGLEKQLNLQ